MAVVSDLITTALQEIGVFSQGETPDASVFDTALVYLENMIDAWGAEELTLSTQSRLAITWPSSTSTRTIGPSMADITAARPVWINQINYVIPGSSPAVEVPLGAMDRDSYAVNSIKGLQSSLPLDFFYQTSLTDTSGTIFLWPQPSQALTLYLYAPQAVGVPTALGDTLIGPPGYQEAFVYQLAMRLCNPFGRTMPPSLPALAEQAMARMQRPNNMPGLLGIDQALVPSSGGAYNILTDGFSAGRSAGS